MFGVGKAEMFILLMMALLLVWPCWRICVKAGLPGPLGLVSLIPFGLFVLLVVWAVVDWPALRRQPRDTEAGRPT
jgi:hypothetical protein